MTLDKHATPEELFAYLTGKLGLDKRTITFHIMDDEIGSGLVNDYDRITDSDAFNTIAEMCSDCPEIFICDVATYQLGSGESDNASFSDITALKDADTYLHNAFDAMLAKYADVLCNLHDIPVENPAYDPEDEE